MPIILITGQKNLILDTLFSRFLIIRVNCHHGRWQVFSHVVNLFMYWMLFKNMFPFSCISKKGFKGQKLKKIDATFSQNFIQLQPSTQQSLCFSSCSHESYQIKMFIISRSQRKMPILKQPLKPLRVKKGDLIGIERNLEV